MEQQRTIHNWAARLSAKDEPLTLAEAHLLASISTADRLVELLTAFQDIQMRLMRLETYIAAHIPDYAPTTRAALRARD